MLFLNTLRENIKTLHSELVYNSKYNIQSCNNNACFKGQRHHIYTFYKLYMQSQIINEKNIFTT